MRSNNIGEHELNEETLLGVEIKDEELSELLERLAATDAMFKTPVPTIRDVAELTESSPKLIARILGEIRGKDDFDHLSERLDAYERRLKVVEHRTSTPPVTSHPLWKPHQAMVTDDPANDRIWETYRSWLDEQRSSTTYDIDTQKSETAWIVSIMVLAIFFITILIVAGASVSSH